MRGPTSLLDKATAMRLLQHGVFLSNKTPPITQVTPESGEGALDRPNRMFVLSEESP